MNLPKDVILDLMPAYMAGECSAASRRLVEEYFRLHPEEAAEWRRAMSLDLPAALATADARTEMEGFREARRRIRARSWMMGIAVFCTLAPMSFYFDGQRMFWLVRESPQAGLAYWLAAAVFWGLYARERRRARGV